MFLLFTSVVYYSGLKIQKLIIRKCSLDMSKNTKKNTIVIRLKFFYFSQINK